MKPRYMLLETHPSDFDFYKIIYDNQLSALMQQEGSLTDDNDSASGIPISIIVPNIGGVIKSKRGKCERADKAPYIKNWELENEVRLKLRIHQVMTDVGVVPLSVIWFKKAAVQLNDSAFDHCQIRFSPKYPEKKKLSTIEKFRKMSPATILEVLD